MATLRRGLVRLAVSPRDTRTRAIHTSVAVLLCAGLVAGCSSEPGAEVTAATSSAPSVSRTAVKLPPLPEDATTKPAPAAPKTTPAGTKSPDGPCGTVTAASGLTLLVELGEGATDCTEAERIVADFHAKIAGQQSADSRRPVAASVDGWDCVSGPPSSQGGTSCTKGSQNVLAGVVAEE